MSITRHRIKDILIISGEFCLLLLILRHAYVMFLALMPDYNLVDFQTVYSGTKSMVHHISPYLVENTGQHQPSTICSPGSFITIHSPGNFTFFLPFLALDLKTATILWIVLNLVILQICLFCVIIHFKLYGGDSPWQPHVQNLIVLFFAYLTTRSQAVGSLLFTGQNTLVAFVLLLPLLLSYKPLDRAFPLFFGGSAAVKFSMLACLAPVLWFRGHWKCCIGGFVIFLFLMSIPCFWMHQTPWDFLSTYVATVMNSTNQGHDSYADPERARALIHMGCFRNNLLNVGIKLFVLALVGAFIARPWIQKLKSSHAGFSLQSRMASIRSMPFEPADLLLLFSATMVVSYHGTYDGAIVGIFLFATVCRDFLDRRYVVASIGFAFLLFFALPKPSVIVVFHLLNTCLVEFNDVFYLTTDKMIPVPIWPFVYFFLTLYAAWRCLWCNSVAGESQLRKANLVAAQ